MHVLNSPVIGAISQKGPIASNKNCKDQQVMKRDNGIDFEKLESSQSSSLESAKYENYQQENSDQDLMILSTTEKKVVMKENNIKQPESDRDSSVLGQPEEVSPNRKHRIEGRKSRSKNRLLNKSQSRSKSKIPSSSHRKKDCPQIKDQ